MKWKPIENLKPDWKDLASDELPPLVKVWEEQSERLKKSGEYKTFMERLCREIAIETGIIERLYSLDRGITRLLIEQGIDEALIPHGTTDRPVKQVVSLIQDQQMAVEGLFDFVGGQRQLSTFYIKELHQLLTQSQETTEALVPTTKQIIAVPLIRGDWKKQPNNPLRSDGSIYEYCPPEQVASEMDNLVQWHHQHQEDKIPPEIEAAWLHHRFTQIHPFQDGNGRVARCLASLVFIQARWFPLVVTRDDRAVYITALEQADRGDLSNLIQFFSRSQKQSFIRCLGLSEQILSESRQTQTIISAIADKLKRGIQQSLEERCQKSGYFSDILYKIALDRIENLVDDIKLSLQNVSNDFDVFRVISTPEKSHYHRYQVVETAKQLKYFANTRPYHKWLQLVINVGSSTIILLSFHVVNREYLGLLACSAAAYHRDNTEDNEQNINEVQSLTDTLFQFSYADEENNLIERFQKWLEEALVNGLEYWNNSL
ncbi:MAG: Fic family protein [Cyanobacteria bacterium SBLK]|nr:Fic family protein [Cyanobacteria bacterium SBLK]